MVSLILALERIGDGLRVLNYSSGVADGVRGLRGFPFERLILSSDNARHSGEKQLIRRQKGAIVASVAFDSGVRPRLTLETILIN